MSARQLPQVDYLTLKAAIRALVKACGGGTAAAAVTRVRQQELSDYGNPADAYAERFMPADVVADLEAECGLPIVTEAMASQHGYLLVPRPDAQAAICDVAALCRITKESADAIAAYGAAVSDGKLTVQEAQTVRSEIAEAQKAFAALDQRLIAILSGDRNAPAQADRSSGRGDR